MGAEMGIEARARLQRGMSVDHVVHRPGQLSAPGLSQEGAQEGVVTSDLLAGVCQMSGDTIGWVAHPRGVRAVRLIIYRKPPCTQSNVHLAPQSGTSFYVRGGGGGGVGICLPLC